MNLKNPGKLAFHAFQADAHNIHQWRHDRPDDVCAFACHDAVAAIATDRLPGLALSGSPAA